MYYTEPRFTKGLDIWINPVRENAEKVFRALERFGAPLEGILVDDFCNKELIYQIGVAPNRIDILRDVAGVSFSSAWQNRITVYYGKTPMHLIGYEDLLKAKASTDREEDKVDLQRLLKIKKRE